MAAVMEEKSALGLREVVLLVFSTLVVFILISLLSFNKEDAGFSHSGSLQAIHNACGVVGAWISDFTLSLFGLMAYCLPIMLAWIGYLVYRDQLHTENNFVIIMRYMGFVITLAFGSALAYLHLLRIGIALPVGTGGILGQELGDLAFVMLGNSGATLSLLAGFLAGITLFTDLSWFGVMDAIGRYTLQAGQIVWRIASGKAPTALKGDIATEPGTSDLGNVQNGREEEPQLSKNQQKLKMAPVMDSASRSTADNSANATALVGMNRLSEATLSRHEPQFNNRQHEAVRVSNEPEPLRADKRVLAPAKANGVKIAEPKLGRQEPQFNVQQPQVAVKQPKSFKATDDDLDLSDLPSLSSSDPIINKPPRQALPEAALSPRVMGFDANSVSGLEEPTLKNYPPQLTNDELAELPPSSLTSDRFNIEDKQIKLGVKPMPFNKTGSVLPGLALLDERDTRVNGYTAADLEAMSRLVEEVLQDFNVTVDVVAVHPGPVITRFELQPAAGVKVSRISGLAKDVARALSVTSVRIVENIPGKSVIGLEIPNQEREMVTLRELLVSPVFKDAKSLLTLAMGKDIAGIPVVADLGKMPHALVAGTTGSGKSVAINTMILSLLYKATPEQVRLIMIDPKMLELSVYEGIPHLLTPVVTDMKEASNALRWAVAEMERRYKLMSKMGVRNLAGFNQLINDASAKGQTIRDPMFQYDKPLGDFEEFPVLTTLPSIVIVIDELADMMMIVGKKVEELIARLAQKARAAGIHLILATQRPSVDVLTGLIKANVPTRISFQVSSRIDSRTILDQGGAETLLGNGDMLFLPSGTAIPVRAHGAFVDDHEVHRVVEFLKQTAPPNYLDEITREIPEPGETYNGSSGEDTESDALYDQAVMFVTESRKASISSVQRRFKVGYNRAARMIEDMEAAGVVSAAESNGYREVLAPAAPRADDF
ncbi:MAG: DNA translocase FtsK 4TM domain-containing protein [Methylococcales bacterium]